MKLSSYLVFTSLIFSVDLFANSTDTQEFREFFEDRFIGISSSAKKDWDNTKCMFRNPVNGDCKERIGDKIYAKGSGTVTNVYSFNGRGVRLTTRRGGWDENEYVEALVDVQYVFEYEGETSARKQCWPGNVYCGMAWGSLHPEGRIHIDIISNPGTNFSLNVWYEVIEGHKDRPNAVVKKAMEKLEEDALSILERWVLNNDIRAEVIIRD